MKFLPHFEGIRHTPFYAPIFLTKDVLYLLSHISKGSTALKLCNARQSYSIL